MTVKIRNKAGRVVAGPLGMSRAAVNSPLTFKFKVPRTWKAGTYRFSVYATDAAGNKAAAVSNKLIVK